MVIIVILIEFIMLIYLIKNKSAFSVNNWLIFICLKNYIILLNIIFIVFSIYSYLCLFMMNNKFVFVSTVV